MKTERNNLIKISLIIGSCLIILGAFFRISNWEGGNVVTFLGFLTLAIYGIMTINKNKIN